MQYAHGASDDVSLLSGGNGSCVCAMVRAGVHCAVGSGCVDGGGKKFTTDGGLSGRMLICLRTQVTCIDILALNQMIPHFEEQFPDVNTRSRKTLLTMGNGLL